MTELDACHHKQQVTVQTELKKEMGLLQKKLLMETVSTLIVLLVCVLFTMHAAKSRDFKCETISTKHVGTSLTTQLQQN